MVEVNQDDLTEVQASAINSGTLSATRELRNVGQAGLELSRNKILTGTRGLERVEISINSDVLPNGVIEDKPARRGQNITTTIDRDLQMLAQKALDEQVKKMGARWGSVIVMDPANGDVLVLADSNSVDPSQPAKTPEANRRSRTVEAVFDPGSVGKVVTFAAALDQGKITPEHSWVCPMLGLAPTGNHLVTPMSTKQSLIPPHRFWLNHPISAQFLLATLLVMKFVITTCVNSVGGA